MDKIEKIVEDIRHLKIQGARNIANAAIEAILLKLKHSKARTTKELYSELKETAELVMGTRPTEPMMRNVITDTMQFMTMEMKKRKSKNDVKKAVEKEAAFYVKKMDEDVKKIAEIGAKLISKYRTVMTYCHSSTVIEILRRAGELNNLHVIVCETRPLFQGRKTAEELSDHVDVTLIVDGAMNRFMKETDVALVGADAITSKGDLVNKIGTATLAHIAYMHDVSFYSAAELYKYDPLTLFGNLERIEERDAREVWDDAPKNIKIQNQAFDVTAAKYISGYITELGVVSPQSFFSLIKEKLEGE